MKHLQGIDLDIIQPPAKEIKSLLKNEGICVRLLDVHCPRVHPVLAKSRFLAP